jgi:DNA-binding SARP family transcriptional activator
LQAGQFVSREALVDGLWPESPPPTAMHAVESYISRLRGLLKAAGATDPVVEFGPAGYRLARDGSWFDHLAFATLADDARGALAREDYATASVSAHEALGLWRGPALAGLASEPALVADAAALDERRGRVRAGAAAELGLGRTGLIGELIARRSGHPTRERLQELAMLALYRAGRQAERSMSIAPRDDLVDELGLEPGPALHGSRRASCATTRRSRTTPRSRQQPGDEPVAPSVVGAPRTTRWRAPALALAGCLLAAGAIAALVARGDGDAAAIAATLQTPAIGRLDATDGDVAARSGCPRRPRVWRPVRARPGRRRTTTARCCGSTRKPGDHADHPGRALPDRRRGRAADVWVANTLDNTLSRVDIATNTIVQRIPSAPLRRTSPRAAGGLVANTRSGSVSRVDPRSGTVVGKTSLSAAPTGLAGADGVWSPRAMRAWWCALTCGRVAYTSRSTSEQGRPRSPSDGTASGSPTASTRRCR